MVLAVVLDNNIWNFCPGQTINGHVVVTKNIWHKVEGLSIRFLGKMEFGSAASAPLLPPRDALPHYQQDRSLFERITRYRGVQDVVLDHKMNLLHSWKVLKPGSHEFPFSYTLPDEDDLPDSIQIDGCRIIYEFVVVLRRPRDDFKVYQTPFYVHTKFLESDLSASETMSKYSNEFCLKAEDTIGFCMCCSTGPYGMRLQVPKRIAYISKDVNFVLEIWNETSIPMECARVVLIREFIHKKGLETKKKEIVSELVGPTTPSGGHEVWANFFRIPSNTPQTNCVRRDIYEINYYLKALLHPVNRASKRLSVKCPILVILPDEDIMPSYDTGTVQTIGHGIPPPTYEEAMAVDNTSTSPLID